MQATCPAYREALTAVVLKYGKAEADYRWFATLPKVVILDLMNGTFQDNMGMSLTSALHALTALLILDKISEEHIMHRLVEYHLNEPV
jgi:hypothetical protein